MSTELVHSVREALDVSHEEFTETVAREVEKLEAELREGAFDNPQAIVGLEYELYGVDESEATLKRVPRPLLDLIIREWLDGPDSLTTALRSPWSRWLFTSNPSENLPESGCEKHAPESPSVAPPR
jgi:hypothetical protein